MGQFVSQLGSDHFCNIRGQDGNLHWAAQVDNAAQGSVYAEGVLVVVVGATCACSEFPNTVTEGSATVFACRAAVARVMDATSGGYLVDGADTVIAGG